MGKFGLKNRSSPNWLKFGTGVHCYILITNLKFIFPKILSLMFFGQIWSHNLDFFKLTEIYFRGTLPCTYYNFNIYFFKVLFIHIFGANWSQNLKFFKLTEIWYRGRLRYAYFDFDVYLFKIFVIPFFRANLVPKSEVLQINWNLVQAYIVTCLLWL